MNLNEKIPLLDHGYVKYVGHMGADENIIEAARMSTGKGFFGWLWEKDTYADVVCSTCKAQHILDICPLEEGTGHPLCSECWNVGLYAFSTADLQIWPDLKTITPKLMGRKDQPRDLSLLEFLYMNRHMTPFEMGDVCIEVKAPIMVFREWHRHRMQSYTEFSARYSQMPNEHYLPALERVQRQSKTNKQGSAEPFSAEDAHQVMLNIEMEQIDVYNGYERLVRSGVAKEIARINTPVSRYSKMRAKTDIRNWLAFLALRMENGAQWEIRQYANAVAQIIKQLFPRTFDLFIEHDFMSVRFSRTEMMELREIIRVAGKAGIELEQMTVKGMTEKKMKAFLDKIIVSKEDTYKEVLTKLGY